MKHPWLLRLSILLNLVLLGMGGWRLAGNPVPPSQGVPTVSREAAPAPSAPPPVFGWSQLEAGDYPAYITNLRAVGCPEETIRDIITADVASQYEERRRQLIVATPQLSDEAAHSPFPASHRNEPAPLTPQESRMTPTQSGHPAMSAQVAGMQLQSLTREQTALLSTLLPSPTPASPAAPAASDPVGNPAVAAPPPPTVQADTPVSRTRTARSDRERELRPRGVLTHEQEVLRAKVGWQAFYYTTAEENAQERAAAAAR